MNHEFALGKMRELQSCWKVLSTKKSQTFEIWYIVLKASIDGDYYLNSK